MKKALLIVRILAFVLVVVLVSGTEAKAIPGGMNMAPEGKGSNQLNQSEDSSVSEEAPFQELEFKYIAPRSGIVYLIWKADNFSVEEAVSWNKLSKLYKGQISNPMAAQGDTFTVQVNVPSGAAFHYHFLTFKNKSGKFEDFRDLQAGGSTIADKSQTVLKHANYTKAVKTKKDGILERGWIVLIILMIAWLLVILFLKPGTGEPASFELKMLFLAISLILFHALARSAVLQIGISTVIGNPMNIFRIIKGSFSDIIYIGSILILFSGIAIISRTATAKKLVYFGFLVVAILSTLIAFVNIQTVIYLGKPFTYQWLYYSDFLGSAEAKTAITANLSVKLILNLLAYVVSMVLVAILFERLYRWSKVTGKRNYYVFAFVLLSILLVSVSAVKIEKTWTKGQSDNAIVAMVSSMISANTNPSLFTLDLTDSLKFDPRKGEPTEFGYNVQAKKQIRNVLLIALESAGARYFDAYGGKYKLSPNLNRYESQSLIFDQMYASTPATNYSLVSILGSMYPYLSYQSITNEDPEFEHPSLSSVLKENGFRTSFFTSANLNFQNCIGFLGHRKFDVVEDYSLIPCNESFQHGNHTDGSGINDICLADRLFAWIDQDNSQPFFSMLWTVQGHYPYFFAGDEEDFNVPDMNLNRYLNCMKHTDKLIGKVMQALEARKLSESTIVVVVGDHGEAFGQHQQYGHGTAIYEENLHVPLYFINPALFNGQRKNDLANLKDLASTLVSLLNVEAPAIWQGRDLLTTDSDELFLFAPWSDYLFAYRKGSMKYIFNESQNTVQVFDLGNDPAEKHNVADRVTKEELGEARNRVAAWVQHQEDYYRAIRIK